MDLAARYAGNFFFVDILIGVAGEHKEWDEVIRLVRTTDGPGAPAGLSTALFFALKVGDTRAALRLAQEAAELGWAESLYFYAESSNTLVKRNDEVYEELSNATKLYDRPPQDKIDEIEWSMMALDQILFGVTENGVVRLELGEIRDDGSAWLVPKRLPFDLNAIIENIGWERAELSALDQARLGNPGPLELLAAHKARVAEWEEAGRLAVHAAHFGASDSMKWLARIANLEGQQEVSERAWRTALEFGVGEVHLSEALHGSFPDPDEADRAVLYGIDNEFDLEGEWQV